MNNQRKFLILAVLVGIAGVGIGAASKYDRLRKMLDNKDAQLHKEWLEEYKKNYEEDKFRSSE